MYNLFIILVTISFLIEKILAISHIVVVLDPVIRWLLEELLQVELFTVKLSYIVILCTLFKVRD